MSEELTGGVLIGGVRGYFDCPLGNPDWFVECTKTGIIFYDEVIEGDGWPALRTAFATIHGRSEYQVDQDISAAWGLADEFHFGECEWWVGFEPSHEPGKWCLGPSDLVSNALERAAQEAGRDLTIEEFQDLFLEVSSPYRRKANVRDVKAAAIRLRRSEFASAKPSLVLAMLNRGDEYVCAEKGCHESDNLTVDHIRPLSRGGTDELDNLQFLCRCHNSSKGAA